MECTERDSELLNHARMDLYHVFFIHSRGDLAGGPVEPATELAARVSEIVVDHLSVGKMGTGEALPFPGALPSARPSQPFT